MYAIQSARKVRASKLLQMRRYAMLWHSQCARTLPPVSAKARAESLNASQLQRTQKVIEKLPNSPDSTAQIRNVPLHATDCHKTAPIRTNHSRKSAKINRARQPDVNNEWNDSHAFRRHVIVSPPSHWPAVGM